MQIIIQQLVEKIKDNLENSVEMIAEGGLEALELNLRAILNEFGTQLIAEAIEHYDQEIKHSQERKKEYNVDNSYNKSLETIFGTVTYKKTIYKHKKTGETKALVDEFLNITSHMRKTRTLTARMINEAVQTCYRKGGEDASEMTTFSDQSVMNAIRDLGPIENNAAEVQSVNQEAKILYIEADEDHVALQDKNKNRIEPKLICVYEDKKVVSKDRKELINPRYFGGYYYTPEELWLEVANYIDENYDYDNIEKIYISGDGAHWIKSGIGWIHKSVHVLDRYHLSKDVRKAFSHMDESEDYSVAFWEELEDKDYEGVKVLLDESVDIAKLKEDEDLVKRVKKARRYILNHFEAIIRQYNPDYLGCSAEGHISHIYAARLSSRPLGWSKIGVDLMSKLRVFMANGGNIFKYIKQQTKEKKKELKENNVIKRCVKKANKYFDAINIDIPVIKMGKKNGSYLAVQSLR